MPEINLGDAPELPVHDPRRVTNYTGPDGRRHQVVDTRPPMHQMRRSDLMRMAERQGFDVSHAPLKDDLIKMLEAPASVRAQLTGGRNLAQAKAAVNHRLTTAQTNVGPAQQHADTKARMAMPAEPEAWEIEAAKTQMVAELMKKPYFTLRAMLAKKGISMTAGEREEAVRAYVEKLATDGE